MPQPDPILESLSIFTRWPVQRTANSYRIRFNYDDLIARAISGIEYGPGAQSKEAFCPRLESREFDQVPILFEMVQNDLNDPLLSSEVHYYTLGGHLHRVDAPAKYTLRPIQTLSMELIYFRHGIMHRDDGPAKITLYGAEAGPLIDQYGNPDARGYRMTVDSAKYHWYIHGQEGVYPNPQRAELDDIQFLYDDSGRYHDFDGEPAIQAGQSRWTWVSRGEKEAALIPISIRIDDLKESYQTGEMKSRDGVFIESAWARGSDSPKLLEGFPNPHVIDQINLWMGPFFRTAAASLRFESEYMDAIDQ